MVLIHRIRCWISSVMLLLFVLTIEGQDRKPQPPLFKASVDFKYMKVSVLDPRSRNVTGLKRESFKVYEDNIEQEIMQFSQESAPISLGFIFDVSGSMGLSYRIQEARNWLQQLIKTDNYNAEDEYFLITFNQKITVLQNFTDDLAGLQDFISLQSPDGWTALYDAIYMGINKIKEAHNEKKALVIISDGGENKSRYKWTDLRELAQESDVQIYAIGVGPYQRSKMKSIAELTGGRIAEHRGISSFIAQIHTDLRSQYLLGYIPSNKARDGTWRRTKVILDKPPGSPPLTIHTREGYYAPKF